MEPGQQLMSVLVIIPARGGSKRIPGKNTKDFLGAPVISYPIRAAIESGCFNEVMVSTDDDSIAGVAKNFGASVPFMRSRENSGDFATTADVIIEVLETYQKLGRTFDSCCCIYPTAPFVTPEMLKEAIQKLNASGADSLVPVTAFSFPVQRSMVIKNDKLSFNWPEYKNTRSQDLQTFYHDCGQFYLVRTKAFLETKNIFTGNTIPFIIEETRVQDIDNETDWKIAEMKYKLLHGLS